MIVEWDPLPLRTAAAVPDAVPRLLAWAAARGVWAEPLEIRTGPDGDRAAHATRALAVGDPLLIVPRHAMITDVDVATAAAALGAGALADSLRSPHSLTALWLGRERADPASAWGPYLDALPPAYPGMPVFRSGAELAALAGTRALIAVSDLAITYRDDHHIARYLGGALAEVPLADYAWGRAVTGSRSYAIDAADGSARALVPLADMLNHGDPDVAWGYDEERAAFVVWADRSIAAGQEVRASYGPHDNARLLVGYGFTLPDNPEDEIAIWLPTHDGPRPYRVGATYDVRFQQAMAAALAWPDTDHAAALGRIGAAVADAQAALADVPVVGAGDARWLASCAQVRGGERAVAAAVLAFIAQVVAEGCQRSADAWRAVAADIDPDATGAARLLRTYAEEAARTAR